MTKQNQNAYRPYASAAEAIKGFIKERLADPDTKGAFTSDQLRNYVQNTVTGRISPSSADRVLRDLRFNNQLNYIVLNRSKSLYRAVPVVTTPSVTAPVLEKQSY